MLAKFFSSICRFQARPWKLPGDVDGDGQVTSADAALCRANVGQPVAEGNFRCDVNLDGQITRAEVWVIQAQLGSYEAAAVAAACSSLRRRGSEARLGGASVRFDPGKKRDGRTDHVAVGKLTPNGVGEGEARFFAGEVGAGLPAELIEDAVRGAG